MKKYLSVMMLLSAFLLPWASWAQNCTQTVPYTEGFEGVTGTSYNAAGTLPACWNGYSNGTSADYSPHVVTGNNTYSYQHTGLNSLVKLRAMHGWNVRDAFPVMFGDIAGLIHRHSRISRMLTVLCETISRSRTCGTNGAYILRITSQLSAEQGGALLKLILTSMCLGGLISRCTMEAGANGQTIL